MRRVYAKVRASKAGKASAVNQAGVSLWTFGERYSWASAILAEPSCTIEDNLTPPHISSLLDPRLNRSDRSFMEGAHRFRFQTTIISALAGAALVFALAFLGKKLLNPSNPTITPRDITGRGALGGDEVSTIRLFESAQASVVYITSLAVERDFISMNVFEIPQGAGSGFIWDSNGYIVTNFHLIQNAQAAKVTLSDQSAHDASLVGAEPDKDIAVLKIDSSRLKLSPIPIGTSKDLRVGQRVYAIGNPFGFDHTLTTGIISGLGREIKSVTERPIQGVIQTDAAINPGNSGGPLLDSAGRLIGMNTAIVSPSGAYSGIGFAVPVDTINRIVPQLIRGGKVKKPGLGIRVIESDLARRQGIVGAIVANVLSGSPAEKHGLEGIHRSANGAIELGDVITSIDDTPVEDGNDLLRVLDEKAPGDRVTLRLNKRGNIREVKVQLGVLQ
jgi:S1-C subfamily serine protease